MSENEGQPQSSELNTDIQQIRSAFLAFRSTEEEKSTELGFDGSGGDLHREFTKQLRQKLSPLMQQLAPELSEAIPLTEAAANATTPRIFSVGTTLMPPHLYYYLPHQNLKYEINLMTALIVKSDTDKLYPLNKDFVGFDEMLRGRKNNEEEIISTPGFPGAVFYPVNSVRGLSTEEIHTVLSYADQHVNAQTSHGLINDIKKEMRDMESEHEKEVKKVRERYVTELKQRIVDLQNSITKEHRVPPVIEVRMPVNHKGSLTHTKLIYNTENMGLIIAPEDKKSLWRRAQSMLNVSNVKEVTPDVWLDRNVPSQIANGLIEYFPKEVQKEITTH